ncbi:hypothetical protein PPERSA_07084 [Pseudocohnilembus persalinus]|uniref:Uncharacterized protein n=1 Tax=Pseudocohnilembus persalinus TaxID=266149 RepID=A0A0V0QWZ8_PSEPJ|nr:hypothetical protein PPERSA_07084 [Pseudocohnilembus persalinus]|eukprot:KRX06921.1 hypothetical protein PPERSA_07084 [Pseudocohnilembus persalinus]
MSHSPLNTSFQFIFNNSFSNNNNINNNNNNNNNNNYNNNNFNNSNINQSFISNNNNSNEFFTNTQKSRKNSDFLFSDSDQNLSIFKNKQGIDALKQFFEVLSKQNLTQKKQISYTLNNNNNLCQNIDEQQTVALKNNDNKIKKRPQQGENFLDILSSQKSMGFFEPVYENDNNNIINKFNEIEECAKENDLDQFLEKAFINETYNQSNFRNKNSKNQSLLQEDLENISSFLSDSEDILDIKKKQQTEISQKQNQNSLKNVVEMNFEFDDEKDDVFAPFEFTAQLRELQEPDVKGEKQKQNLAVDKDQLNPFDEEDFSVDPEIQFEAIDLEEIQKKARALKKLQQSLPNNSHKEKQRGRLKDKISLKKSQKLNQAKNLICTNSDSEENFQSSQNLQQDEEQSSISFDIRILQVTQKMAQEKRQKDYDKNICRYIARSVIRCLTSQSYQAEVLSICQDIINIFMDDNAKQNSVQLKNYFASIFNIELSNQQCQIQKNAKIEEIKNQSANLPFKIYQRCYDYFMQQLEGLTGHRAYASLLTFNDDNRLVEKMILRKFSTWFLKKRALRYILNGNMKDKKSYINYKNKVMINFINQPEAWTSNIVRVHE